MTAARGARAGVSLIELLAVLTIIAILAALALGRSRTARDRAEVTRLMTEARALRHAQEVYRAEKGTYYPGPFTPAATSEAGFGFAVPPGRTLRVAEAGKDAWRGELVLGEGPEGTSAGAKPYCAIALRSGPAGGGEEGVACTLPSGRQSDQPGDEGRTSN